jgi:hypothetical protein
MRQHFGKFIVLLVTSMVIAGVLLLRHTDTVLRNSYAQWWVADMVVLHLEANDQKWPKSWDELRDDYETCVRRSGPAWSYEELTSGVMIDWDADPLSLKSAVQQAGRPPFRVLWLSDGSSSHWESREPNQIIWEYLQTRSQEDRMAKPSPASGL